MNECSFQKTKYRVLNSIKFVIISQNSIFANKMQLFWTMPLCTFFLFNSLQLLWVSFISSVCLFTVNPINTSVSFVPVHSIMNYTASITQKKISLKRCFSESFFRGVKHMPMTIVSQVKTTSGGDQYYQTHHEMSSTSVLIRVFRMFFSKVIPPESLKRGFQESMNTKISINSERKKQSTWIKTGMFLKPCRIEWCKILTYLTNIYETVVFFTLNIKFT